MSRQRLYDENLVRQNIMALFHQKSFSDTSLADLEVSTGLNRRQLYNNFGDKTQMFLSALRDFATGADKAFLSPLRQGDLGLSDIKTVFTVLTDMADQDQGRFGCLMCNTAREPIMQQAPIAEIVNQFFDQIKRSYKAALQRAQTLDEVSMQHNIDKLATFYMGIHVSICVLGRAEVSSDTLRTIASESLKKLAN